MSKKPSSVISTFPAAKRSSTAFKIFQAFLTNQQMSLTEDELRSYAINDLNMPVEAHKLPVGFMEHLPVILVSFMNMWSGWQFKGDYFNGKIAEEHYYQRFQKFMIHKLKVTISSHYNNAIKAVGVDLNEAPPVDDVEFAPYQISIKCPAQMLNTIVFSNAGDDVIMKQHLGAKWQELSPAQLLNWPHIEVKFQTPDIFIVRKQATEFTRYLNFLPHESNDNNDPIIESATTYGRPECFSLDFLEKYIKVYLDTLRSLPMISLSMHFEIQTILSQFLDDVRHINVQKSMATNTSVLFRLCNVPFIRNKKLVKSPEGESQDARVGYCEIITPKIQLLMPYFRAKQIQANFLAFEFVENLKKSTATMAQIMPSIAYKCTFCEVERKGERARADILEHLKLEHKMEQHVRCTHCKKQFDVLNLAACRWRHKCQPPKASEATQTPNGN